MKNSKLHFFLPIFFLILFTFFPQHIFADTVLDENLEINTDTVWTKAESPYVVSDCVFLQPGVTLTIEPGVTVKMNDLGHYGGCLYVFGNLLAKGIETDPIVFDIEEDGLSQSWYIIFEDQSNSSFDYVSMNNLNNVEISDSSKVDFSNGKISSEVGVRVFNGSSVSFNNFLVDINYGRALEIFNSSSISATSSSFKSAVNTNETVKVYRNSSLDLYNSLIEGGLDNAVSIFSESNAVIKKTVIQNGVFGIFFGGSIRLAITDSEIKNFSDVAIGGYCPVLDIKNSKISGNGTGLYLDVWKDCPGNVDISQSIIADNDAGFIWNNFSNVDGSTSIFNAKNNWWGDASGPLNITSNPDGKGNEVTDGVVFSPWLSAPPEEKNPVIIIPGILGSYLNKGDGTEVWPNIEKALLPFGDTYLDDLILNDNGIDDKQNIKIGDVTRKILGKDFFQGLITKLKGQYREGKDLFVFPYDWRFDIDSIARDKLDLFIDDILKKTGAKKVDIVAHSMGGLVTKAYVKDFGGEKIGKFIDIATPHLGSPSAFKLISYGDDLGIKFGLLGLNPDEVKKISQNMPSAYELLPSAKYFDSSDPDYKYYFADLGDADNNGFKGKLSFSDTFDFLRNSGRNQKLLDKSKTFGESLSEVDPEKNGIETFNIVGCGTPTIGKIFTLDKNAGENRYALGYITGDGTVPLKSAEAINATSTYYISGGIEHATLPSFLSVRDLTLSLLSGQEMKTLPKEVGTTSSDCKLPKGKYISVHSPISIDVYDSLGNHSGPNKDGDIEQNVPGVIYDSIEENKFIFIPDGQNYQINYHATGLGSFSIDIKTSEEMEHFDYFTDIPISNPNLWGRIVFSPSPSPDIPQTPTVIVHEDGGPSEKILSPDISGNTDLNVKKAEEIEQKSALSESNTFSKSVGHSQGFAVGNLPGFSDPKFTDPNISNPISKMQKIFKPLKIEGESSSFYAQKEYMNSSLKKNISRVENLASVSSVAGNIPIQDFLEKIFEYLRSIWSFLLKILHIIK